MSFDPALLWIVFALFAGIFSGAMMLLNQYYQVPGLLMVLVSRGITICVLLPFAFLIDWPDAPVYYIAVAMTGVLASYADIRLFNVAAKLGGGVTSRLVPLLVPATFFFWFFFAPEQIHDYLAAPLNSLMIIAALGGCVFFAMRLKTNCTISAEALKLMTPVILCYGFNGALAKLALNNAPLHAGVYGYMLIQTVVALSVTFGYYRFQRRRKDAPDTVSFRKSKSGRMWLACALASFIWLAHMVFKIYAFGFTDNPAYVNAVVLLAPLWVILFYRLTGYKDNANISAGLGILASTILLVLLTV